MEISIAWKLNFNQPFKPWIIWGNVSYICILYRNKSLKLSTKERAIENSSPPSAAYMCRWTGPALVQVMNCHLFGATPSPEAEMTYCQLDP